MNNATVTPLKVRVFPYRQKIGMGNIIWAERDRGSSYYRVSVFAMKKGKFPPDHPVGGGDSARGDAQCGQSDEIAAFRRTIKNDAKVTPQVAFPQFGSGD